jgi:hypothetical protein
MAQLVHLGQQRHEAGPPGRPQVTYGGASVVPRVERDVDDLLEGVPAGLAALGLHEVEHLVLAGEHQVVQPEEHAGPLGHRPRRPAALGLAGPGEGGVDVGLGRDRQLRHRGAVEGRPGRHGLAGGRHDGAHQPGLLGLHRHTIMLLAGNELGGTGLRRLRGRRRDEMRPPRRSARGDPALEAP